MPAVGTRKGNMRMSVGVDFQHRHRTLEVFSETQVIGLIDGFGAPISWWASTF